MAWPELANPTTVGANFRNFSLVRTIPNGMAVNTTSTVDQNVTLMWARN